MTSPSTTQSPRCPGPAPPRPPPRLQTLQPPGPPRARPQLLLWPSTTRSPPSRQWQPQARGSSPSLQRRPAEGSARKRTAAAAAGARRRLGATAHAPPEPPRQQGRRVGARDRSVGSGAARGEDGEEEGQPVAAGAQVELGDDDGRVGARGLGAAVGRETDQCTFNHATEAARSSNLREHAPVWVADKGRALHARGGEARRVSHYDTPTTWPRHPYHKSRTASSSHALRKHTCCHKAAPRCRHTVAAQPPAARTQTSQARGPPRRGPLCRRDRQRR